MHAHLGVTPHGALGWRGQRRRASWFKVQGSCQRVGRGGRGWIGQAVAAVAVVAVAVAIAVALAEADKDKQAGKAEGACGPQLLCYQLA